MGINISLSEDVIQSLPRAAKEALLIELQRRLQGTTPTLETAVAPPAAALVEEVNEEEEQAADLSVAQAMRFLEGCSEKTKKVIRAIVGGGSRDFRLTALAQTLNLTIDDVGGVWGGLTKRTRTILGDKKSKLIAWTRNFYDAQDNWIDAAGEVSEVTYVSFRKALEV